MAPTPSHKKVHNKQDHTNIADGQANGQHDAAVQFLLIAILKLMFVNGRADDLSKGVRLVRRYLTVSDNTKAKEHMHAHTYTHTRAHTHTHTHTHTLHRA